MMMCSMMFWIAFVALGLAAAHLLVAVGALRVAFKVGIQDSLSTPVTCQLSALSIVSVIDQGTFELDASYSYAEMLVVEKLRLTNVNVPLFRDCVISWPAGDLSMRTGLASRAVLLSSSLAVLCVLVANFAMLRVCLMLAWGGCLALRNVILESLR
jgi:hypothetical protein